MQIRPATKDDVHAIARLALNAGEGMPGYRLPNAADADNGNIVLLTRPAAP